MGYFHRDLKPENLLIRNDYLLKITDFGIIKDNQDKNLPLTTYISTRWYRAPETILRSKTYDFKVDIFAIGCIMAEMYSKTPLFPGNSALD